MSTRTCDFRKCLMQRYQATVILSWRVQHFALTNVRTAFALPHNQLPPCPVSLSPTICLKTKEDIDCSLQSMTHSDSASAPLSPHLVSSSYLPLSCGVVNKTNMTARGRHWRGGAHSRGAGGRGQVNVSVMIIKVYDSSSWACKANVNLLFRSGHRQVIRTVA